MIRILQVVVLAGRGISSCTLWLLNCRQYPTVFLWQPNVSLEPLTLKRFDFQLTIDMVSHVT